MGSANFLGLTQTIAAGSLFASARQLVNSGGSGGDAFIDALVADGSSGTRIGDPLLFALGNRPTDGKIFVLAYGRNTDVDSGSVPEVICPGGTLTGFHGVAATDELAIEVIGDDAADAPGGAGAQKVFVTGIEATTGLPVIARFTLTGLAAVSCDGPVDVKFARIQSAYTYPAANVGAVTITAKTGGSAVAIIPAGAGRMPAAWVHVPCGYTGEVLSVSGGCETASGTATMAVTVTEPSNTRTIHTFQVSAGNPYASAQGVPIGVVDEYATVRVSATASTDNATLFATIVVLLKKTPNPTPSEKLHKINEQIKALIRQLSG